jgi:hypothetical protein
MTTSTTDSVYQLDSLAQDIHNVSLAALGSIFTTFVITNNKKTPKNAAYYTLEIDHEKINLTEKSQTRKIVTTLNFENHVFHINKAPAKTAELIPFAKKIKKIFLDLKAKKSVSFGKKGKQSSLSSAKTKGEL